MLTRRARTLLLSVAALDLLAVSAGSASALPSSRTPDPTWQANGRVLAILRVGNVVYLGGDFTQVMAHGGGKTAARNHLAAFNANTGNLLAWNPNADGRVRALASAANGTVIFAGGDFTPRRRRDAQPRGQAGRRRRRQADRTGRPRPTASCAPSRRRNNKLYMGGDFTSVNSHARARLAAVGGAGGALQPWAPQGQRRRAGGAAGRAPRVFIGGDFATINGKAQPHLAVVGAQ